MNRLYLREKMILTSFHSIRPPFESLQEDTLEWLIDAHLEAELKKGLPLNERDLFREQIKERLFRVGCKPDRIEKRGHILKDLLHRNWNQMSVYRLDETPSGKDLSVRSKIYKEAVDQIFEEYYPENTNAPDDLIHVSCTGYISPSGAQGIVSKRGWGARTTVTHAYHMGCYGSIPAIRMATGFLSMGKKQVDIVHTEVCSLHTNPSLHGIDQLVSQSLFADGFIKYSVLEKSDAPHYQVIALHEEVIDDSRDAMTWNVSNWGFQMTLTKEVPVLISRALKNYLIRLANLSNISYEKLLKEAIFAIHPGGPKILLYIQELLGLKDHQMKYSFDILRKYGNMSSCTLPHIWDEVLRDRDVLDRTPLVSLAFGPGLSISGNLLEKRCGS